MGAFQKWLDKQPIDTACCPDPDPDYIDAMDMADPFPEEQQWGGIEAYGFDPLTPVDTLMSGPVQMHLDMGDDLLFGNYA